MSPYTLLELKRMSKQLSVKTSIKKMKVVGLS